MVIAIVNGTSLKQWSYLDYLMFRNGSKIQSKITLCAMINFAFAWKKLPTNNFFRVSTVKWINSKDFQSIAKRKTIPRRSDYDAIRHQTLWFDPSSYTSTLVYPNPV